MTKRKNKNPSKPNANDKLLIKFKNDAEQKKKLIGEATLIIGTSKAGKVHGISKQLCNYYKKKILDSTFHPGKHLPPKRNKYDEEHTQLLHAVLWLKMHANPSKKLSNYVQDLKEFGFDVSLMYISRVFKSWRWSFKKPNRSHLLKYTTNNINNYANFSIWITTVPWLRLKFVDEVHFVSRGLLNSKVLGPVNQKTVVVDYCDLTETYSGTALLNLQKPENPIFLSFRVATNTQDDFLLFLIQAIETKNLISGDVLVLDNAGVHGGFDTWPILEKICQLAEIQIVFLPMYSPELNPIELVFGQVKHYLRNNRNEQNEFLIEIIKGFTNISYEKILNFYYKCTQLVFS